MSAIQDELRSITLKVESHVGHLVDPIENPDQYIRDLYARWKAGGGTIGGRPRHSDRYLDEMLRERGTVVRSLTPKLASGRTNIKAIDGAILINFFLSNWPQLSGSDDSELQYVSVLEKHEINRLAAHIEAQIEAQSDSAPEEGEGLPGLDAALVLKENFEQCDAMITVAPEHILVSTGPKRELIGFRNTIDLLRNIEERDGNIRPIIWVLDLGDQRFDDESSRKKFLNVQALLARLKALKRSREPEADKRFKWLSDRGVVILLDMWADVEVKNNKRPQFAAHHISLTTIATEWLASVEFRALYGSKLEKVDQRNFSIYYKQGGWPEIHYDLRFFGTAQFSINEEKSEYSTRAIELPRLPGRYIEAFHNVCAAGYYSLGIETNVHEVSGEEAVSSLEYLGYAVLRLEKFMEIY